MTAPLDPALLAVVTKAMEEAKHEQRNRLDAWPTDEEVVTAMLSRAVTAGLQHLTDGDGR